MRRMDHFAQLRAILRNDPWRSRVLGLVRSLELTDCWVGAGFIRNAVWDHLHGRPATRCSGDVDVLWFDPCRVAPCEDLRIEAELRALEPSIEWSVKNQARMHERNGDARYASVTHAMLGWPETATAVAAQWTELGDCEIAAPFGIEDLFSLILRPTPRFMGEKYQIPIPTEFGARDGWRTGRCCGWPVNPGSTLLRLRRNGSGLQPKLGDLDLRWTAELVAPGFLGDMPGLWSGAPGYDSLQDDARSAIAGNNAWQQARYGRKTDVRNPGRATVADW